LILEEKSTIRELFSMYNKKDIARHELKESCTDILQNIDSEFNAFISFTEDFCIEDGPAFPCVVADNICVENLKTTCGSEILEGYKSPFTAFALEKAFSQGFTLLGKTNLDEFGIGDCTGESFYKTTLNPCSTDHLAGSGAAAAVAAGAAATGFASDARGGLRQAASFCGLVGLKPTYGLVSRRGLIDYASSLDQIGVLAANANDAALGLSGISGFDGKDPTSQEIPMDEAIDIKKIRIATLQGWDKVDGLTGEVKEVFENTLSTFSAADIDTFEVPFPYLPLSAITSSVIGAVEAFSNLANFDGIRFGKRVDGDHLQDMYIKTRSSCFGKRVREYITYGALMSSGKNYREYFLWAQKNRRAIYNSLTGLLKEYDFIILPTLPFTAPLLSEKDSLTELNNAADVYTSLANLAGLPAVTVPAGVSGNMPVGVQLLGRPFSEEALLKMAKILEEKCGRYGNHEAV
jgi:aspartyl-tRNA(Asn)/glutamyl-tRNA(Gln) amidotransferase subunit A